MNLLPAAPEMPGTTIVGNGTVRELEAAPPVAPEGGMTDISCRGARENSGRWGFFRIIIHDYWFTFLFYQ
jgi:hypothetical protein